MAGNMLLIGQMLFTAPAIIYRIMCDGDDGCENVALNRQVYGKRYYLEGDLVIQSKQLINEKIN